MDFQTAQTIQAIAFFTFCSIVVICVTWYKYKLRTCANQK
jgi:hypothetical protein